MHTNPVSENPAQDARAAIAAVYRAESRRVLATLIRLLGDFDLAEDALHEAFAAALERWPGEGQPANPRAWLVSTGRFKAIDALRRRARFDAAVGQLAAQVETAVQVIGPTGEDGVDDDRLRQFGLTDAESGPNPQIVLEKAIDKLFATAAAGRTSTTTG